MYLTVDQISKTYGPERVLDACSLQLPQHETLSILGRSGSGKTTLLKVMAGLEQADAGQVLLEGRNMHAVPPHQRNIVYLYQEPLLFPHLDVFGNLAFGLRLRHTPEGQIQERVEHLLEELEREERGGSISGDLKNATLEHIIPLSERRGKEAPLVRRFGNYALLEERLHRPLGSKPSRQKVQAYQQSEFRLTRQLSGSSYDAVELEKRQKSLGILAASRWRLNLVT